MKTLIQKYNVPGPRYTSYPAVPHWKGNINAEDWITQLKNRLVSSKNPQVACYIHLPFCESLCTFCGCNKIITKNHNVEAQYAAAVLKEWGLYRDLVGLPITLAELHLGGGTPTFYHPETLASLVENLLSTVRVATQPSFSFEAHPNTTKKEHLEQLRSLGFRRVSFGIQDFDERVQAAIRRRQSFAQVRQVTETARQLGYNSVNFDLIYGLPFQNRHSMEKTLFQVGQLKPDRIAFYSYAHVPWIKPSQRHFTESDLPTADEKRALYEQGCEFLPCK